MPSDLLRDLLIVNRRIFDEAVATVQAQANHDIDRALREASLWAYREASRRPKSELRQINEEAQKRAEHQIEEIQSATASKAAELKTQHHDREQRIRAYCDQLERQNQQPGDDQATDAKHASPPESV